MTFKVLPVMLALVFGSAGCLGDDEDSYENEVRLTCNGTVLLDRTFTSKAECEAHRAQSTYTCAGVALTITC
ncbi:MAG: hypothetical protein H0T42_22440 [Deltaproteobacteria bacterium]|nr:hypothetical protein [Deltaproteobacteria bacterium]